MIKFIKYCGIGTINFLVCVTVMSLLANLGVHYVLYTCAGYITAIIISFVLNYRFTFQSLGNKNHRFLRFILINPLNLIIVECLQILLIEMLKWPTIPSILTGMAYYTLTGFFLNQRFVFENELSA